MYLAKNIRFLRKKNDWSQEYIAEKLGYKSYTTIQKWEMGTSEPPLKKLKELATLFNVDINDLANKDFTASSESIDIPYYINDDAREIAQFMFEHPEYKVLFDASRKISKEDIETVKAIMDRFKRPDD